MQMTEQTLEEAIKDLIDERIRRAVEDAAEKAFKQELLKIQRELVPQLSYTLTKSHDRNVVDITLKVNTVKKSSRQA